jgi:hypothetical protein
MSFRCPCRGLEGTGNPDMPLSRKEGRFRLVSDRFCLDGGPAGHTHNFYRYPARFSPQFARAAVEAFSAPGDTVLDPFVGGGTATSSPPE